MAAAGRCAGSGQSVARSVAVFCLSDFEKYARTQLNGNAWGYYSSGADQELTLKDNEEAFRRLSTTAGQPSNLCVILIAGID